MSSTLRLAPPYRTLRELIESTTRDAVAGGPVDEKDAEEWLQDLEQRAATGRFFAAFSYFRVVGYRTPSEA